MNDNKFKFVRREGAAQYLAFRVCEWFDASAMKPRYGVQAQVEKGMWCHIAHNGSPLLFTDKIDARDEVKRLQQARAAQ